MERRYGDDAWHGSMFEHKRIDCRGERLHGCLCPHRPRGIGCATDCDEQNARKHTDESNHHKDFDEREGGPALAAMGGCHGCFSGA